MEKGEGPPKNIVVTSDMSDVPAPPYPGPPLDPSVMLKQSVSEQSSQSSPQPVVQQCQQPVVQQFQQPVAQQFQQPVAQQYPQPGQQPVTQYVPPQNQPGEQIIVTQQMPTDAPGRMLCPHCKNTVTTSVEHKVGVFTLVIFGIMCFLICWPCSWIPFILNSCKDVQHSCPQCNNVLHVYKRM